MDTFFKIQNIRNLKNIEKIEQASYNFWKWFAMLFIGWLILTYLRVYIKYKDVIKKMNEAKKNGSLYFTTNIAGPEGPSPWMIGAIFEYPWLAFFEESNETMGTSILYSYYNPEISKIMGSGCAPGKAGTSEDYLYILKYAATICKTTPDHPNCDVFNVICRTFNNVTPCKKQCKSGPDFNAGLVYTQSIVQSTTGLGFLGHMSGAGAGLGIGVLVGVGIGVYTAYSKQQEHNKRENANKTQGCIKKL